jgi:hypothetical protein
VKKPIPDEYIIKTEDFVRAFGNKFPVVSVYPDVASKLEVLWKNQKVADARMPWQSDNKVDTLEYWNKILER